MKRYRRRRGPTTKMGTAVTIAAPTEPPSIISSATRVVRVVDREERSEKQNVDGNHQRAGMAVLTTA